MEENTLARVLHSVAKRVRADFEQSQQFNHNLSAGESRELIAHDFLAHQLPRHIEAICGAEIATADGAVSPQCDIILADRSTPPLTHLQGYRIVPSECVYGMIEVKTRLNKQDLIDACEKVRKVKALPKAAYFPYPTQIPPPCQRHGKTYPYMPTIGMIFAFDSIDLDTLGEHFIEWCSDKEPEERPDSIWILGKGFFTWAHPASGLIHGSPEPGSSLVAMDPWHDEDILLPLALHLNMMFANAWMPPLRLIDYARQHPLGVSRRLWKEGERPSSE
ncbi:DUF6602 domain-containing protein [Streptomyces cavourensis]|uniref:DUF6602 domain-containing protein n=1 Tax=Streptomyces cavourensis TaxID=67258 RepID=UPI001C95163F|nr:DUF6602 domain-containing protein [Streptomyces cavourensis]